MQITRRSLVKGAALGVAGTAMAGAGVAAADEAAAFDEEYDVVVLGMGGAGMNAAVAAYEEGAKVLLCEKAPEGMEPGNTKVCGQVILSTDDADQFYIYLKQLMGKYQNYDDECLRAFADGAEGNWSWMMDVLGGDPDVSYWSEEPDWTHLGGARWQQVDSFMGIDRPGWILIWDEFPEFEGSEHALIYTFSGREHDSSYYNKLVENIEQREGDNLVVYKGCPGKELILDDSGTVIGVVVEKDGAELRIKANGGVCLCTGGFEANRTMIGNYLQMPYAYSRAGSMNTGDGILMAQRAGAQLWHMSNISGLSFAYHKEGDKNSTAINNGPARGIYVGPAGGRFMNEQGKSRHGRISFGGDWKMTPVTFPAYLVMDSDQIADPLVKGFSDGNADEIASGIIISGETLEELGANVRAAGKAPDFDANGELEAAIAKYNAYVESGEPDDFGRTCTVPVATPPFYALELCPTMLNTQGGPRHNAKAQVLNLDGVPIEGLFSGGELGSIFPDMYNGGGNIGETMIFGRIAGQNAAKRAKGDFEGATEPSLLVQEQADAEAAAAEAQALADAAATVYNLNDGTYEGEGEGFSSTIALSITVEGGKISACEITSSAETAYMGEAALPTYCSELVETQNPALVDVAAGASTTLKGFVAAAEDALAQASA